MCEAYGIEMMKTGAYYDHILWRHQKKATFEEFYGYLHTNTLRIVETFLIAIKLGIIT